MQNQFEKMGIDEDFNPLYLEMGIKRPTDVQVQVIPKLMERKSTICVAQTGSGKTLSYALPVSELIKQHEDENGLSQATSAPQAVVIVPTKELGMQIVGVFKKISHHAKLRIRTLIGKTSPKSQSYEILITTPHKLAQALKKKDVSFEMLKYLIFDEADQLFDMGFKRDLESVLRFVEYDQTDIHFFSATMPVEVAEFLDEKFRKKKLDKVFLNSAHSMQQKIETFNVTLEPDQKTAYLKSFLLKSAKGRGIVFVNQKNQLDELHLYIKENFPKLKYRVLHGGMPEKERLAAIKSFGEKKAQILFATDVAARGIDFDDIAWVLNYGLPKTAIYYLHRCGRTARAGRSGVVYNFVTRYDNKIISQINEAIKSQSKVEMALISNKSTQVRRKKPVKTKRVKITKRTRR